MDFTTLFFVFLFYLFILFVGVLASKKEKSSSSHEVTLSDHILGGRRISLFVGVLTMTATWVGGGYINGTAEAVYANGLIWAQAPWGYALSLIIGGLFFAKKMREKRYTTLLDPFSEKYGDRVTSLLYIPSLIGDVFWSSAILAALGHTFATLLGLDFTTAVIISSAVAIAYTFLGGLWSVAYTDVVQLIFIFFGLTLAIPFVLNEVGGLDTLIVHYTDHFGEKARLFPSLSDFQMKESSSLLGKQIWYWLDSSLLLVLGGIPWGVYFQRVLACPSEKMARNLSFAAGLGCILMAIPAAILGASALSLDWSFLGDGVLPDASSILPAILKYHTPKWVSIFGLSAIAAAVMSSIDSSILSSASMFTWNIYKPLKKETNSKKLIIITKIATLVIGTLATLLALKVQSVYALWYLCADLVYVLLFPQLVMVLFFKKSSKVGAVMGLAIGLFLRLGGGEASIGIPAFLPYPMNDPDLGLLFPFRSFAMLLSLIAIPFFSLLFPSKQEKN